MIKSTKNLAQKTIFVLVHTSDMLSPSGVEISLESKKSFSTNPLIYNKTLWSAVCESVLEYIRIVYDIFGTDREMALIVVDFKERICISTNDKNLQSWRSWMKVLSEIGSPQNATPSLVPNVLPGFNSIKSVLELKSDNETSSAGRVIVLGYRMGENVTHWVEEINTALSTELVNGACHVSDSEWYFIDVEPAIEGSQGDEIPLIATNNLSTRHNIYRQTVMANNRDLHRSLMSLCEQQHDLACILVQNIPMKEDTNNTQSAMYGVELIHPRAALDHIVQAGLLPLMTMAHRPYCGFSSCIGIRWVTPKQTQDIEYYNTKNVYRITTADVCHRASCCLANFVLEGRSVVLEVDHGLVPNAPPGLPEPKYELLLLTSHSGMLHVHTLCAHRDPIFPSCDSQTKMPLFSDLLTKKVANKLRIADFSQFILANRLVPAAPQSSFLPMERAIKEIEQHTRYWPELTSDTLVFNKPLMPKVADILSKKYLDFSEKSNCIGFLQQMIFDQSNAEKSAKKTGTQPESKAFKTELELVLWLYQDRSTAHKEVLDSFEVFGSSLKGLVDLSSLISTGEDGQNCVNVGLPKLERLLKDGAAQLKEITQSLDKSCVVNNSNINKNTNNCGKNILTSRKQQRRPEQGTLTLREVLSIASDSFFIPKRKRFDGELAAIDNITELYPPNLPPSSLVDPRKE